MARIGLAIAGGIIGGIIGGPMGAELGFSLGNLAGSILFPPKLPTNYGPRLNDKQVTSSASGEPIPFGYGGFRIAGNIIWSQQIQEITTTQSQSAKGGPSSSSVTYTYTATFAIAFCQGPATITRLWADSKLIYDTTSKTAVTLDTGIKDAGGVSHTVKYTPTVYSGTATQMPDPTIQSFLGAGLTPAYRDLVYAVFNDLPLADFGNRIPTIRAEISTGNVLSYVKDAYPANSLSANAWTFSLVDPINRIGYFIDSVGANIMAVDLAAVSSQPLSTWQANTVFSKGQQILDSNGNVQYVSFVAGDSKSGALAPTWATTDGVLTTDNHVTWIKIGVGPNAVTVLRKGAFTFKLSGWTLNGSINSGAPLSMCVDTSGYIWGQANLTNISTGATGFYPVKWDPNTFQAIAVFSQNWGGQLVNTMNSVKLNGRDYVYIVTAENFSPGSYLWKIDAKALTGNFGFWRTQPEFTAGSFIGYPTIDPATGICYLIEFQNLATPLFWYISKIDLKNAPVNGRWQSTVFTFNAAGSASWGVGSGSWFDSTDNTLIVYNGWGPGGSYGNNHVLWKIDPVSGNIITNTSLSGNAFGSLLGLVYLSQAYTGRVPSDNILKLFAADNKSIAYYSTADLSLQNTVALVNWEPNLGTGTETVIDGFAYDDATESALMTPGSYQPIPLRFYFNRQAVQSQTLDTIVSDILQRCGVVVSNIDVSALSGINCKGYCVTRTSDAKAAVQPLALAYFFDLVETGFKIKAVLRGQSASVNIPETDLGLSDDKFKLVETIAQQQDIPKTVSVEYQDPALNYQQGKQLRYRHSRVKKTKNQDIIMLPITLNGDDAAQIADKYLTMLWAERNMYDFKLWGYKYLTIDPTDVVQFTYNGLPFQARIVKTTIGQNKILEISGVSEDARNYLSTLTGASTQGFDTGSLKIAGATLLFILDTPLLQDIDANGTNTGFYYLMSSPTLGSWPGGALYQSTDGGNTFGQIDSDFTEAVYGVVPVSIADAAFSNGVLHPFSWDTITTINVRLAQGTLSSTTELAVLNGANAFILGNEVMQFQNATLNSDGTYTLSKLLRGVRGTEYACHYHKAGETFILLNASTRRIQQSSAVIGLLRYYKAVTLGQSQSSASVIQDALQGNDLKPYAPAQFTGSYDGGNNINTSWVRRTRVGGAWLGGTPTVPMSEQSESYDLDVMWLNNNGQKRQHYTSTPASGLVQTFFDPIGNTYYLQIAPFTMTWDDGTVASYLGRRINVSSSSSTGPRFVSVFDQFRQGDAGGAAGIVYSVQDTSFTGNPRPDQAGANLVNNYLIGVIPAFVQGAPLTFYISGGGGDAAVRTYSGLNTPTVSYTSSQQTADWGRLSNSFGAPGFVRMRVYQNSATVGRGFGTDNPSVGKGGPAVSGGSDATSILGVPITGTPADGDILQYNSVAGAWQIVGPLLKSQTITKTTASLANGSAESGSISVACKSFILIMSSADRSARIQLYDTAANQSADSGRPANFPPDALTQNGIMADHLLTAGGAETYNCSPPLICTNHDTPRAQTIYYQVTNNSGSTSTVTVTLTIIPIEL